MKLSAAAFILSFFVFTLSCSRVSGQSRNQWYNVFHAGVVGGAGSSWITDVKHIIITEDYFVKNEGITYWNYTHNVIVPKVGLFLNYQREDNPMGDSRDLVPGDNEVRFTANGEVTYSVVGDQYHFFNQDIYGLDYIMKFRYENLDMLATAGGKWRFLYLNAGIQFGLNLSPDKITYTSTLKKNPTDTHGEPSPPGDDLLQQQELRNVLRGKNNVGVVMALGGQACRWLDVESRFHYGIKDMIDVQPNQYNFAPHSNRNFSYELVVKFYITALNRL